MIKPSDPFIIKYLQKGVVNQFDLPGGGYRTTYQCKVIDQHGKIWDIKEDVDTAWEYTIDGFVTLASTRRHDYDWKRVINA